MKGVSLHSLPLEVRQHLDRMVRTEGKVGARLFDDGTAPTLLPLQLLPQAVFARGEEMFMKSVNSPLSFPGAPSAPMTEPMPPESEPRGASAMRAQHGLSAPPTTPPEGLSATQAGLRHLWSLDKIPQIEGWYIIELVA